MGRGGRDVFDLKATCSVTLTLCNFLLIEPYSPPPSQLGWMVFWCRQPWLVRWAGLEQCSQEELRLLVCIALFSQWSHLSPLKNTVCYSGTFSLEGGWYWCQVHDSPRSDGRHSSGYTLDFRVKRNRLYMVAEAFADTPGTLWGCKWPWEGGPRPPSVFMFVL